MKNLDKRSSLSEPAVVPVTNDPENFLHFNENVESFATVNGKSSRIKDPGNQSNQPGCTAKDMDATKARGGYLTGSEIRLLLAIKLWNLESLQVEGAML